MKAESLSLRMTALILPLPISLLATFGDERGQEVQAVIDAWKAVGVIDPSDMMDIQDVVVTEDAVDPYYYDLQGRKYGSTPTTKGIYIHKGNKVIIR